MGLKLITPPASEPITINEAKSHLRVDGTDEDGYIEALISAAREYCEGYQNRVYVSQTWELSLDAFPVMPLELPKPPLISVGSIKYRDKDGIEADFVDYVTDVDSFLGRVAFAYGKLWPSVALYPIAAVKIRFTAGYTAVPKIISQAMLLLIGHWYTNREPVGSVSGEMEFTVHALLGLDRVIPI